MIYAHYLDDGALGAGAQCMSRTSAWSKLLKFESIEKYQAYLTELRELQNSKNKKGHRRNPRIVEEWSDDFSEQQLLGADQCLDGTTGKSYP